ncbi:MAG: hypothetical protein GC180_07640 [Bacteroidetes bacterium]|nr:hypothetical protein [Bacteroidota bacterium]
MKKLLFILSMLISLCTEAQLNAPLPTFDYIYQLSEKEVVALRENDFKHSTLFDRAPFDSIAKNQNAYQYLLKQRKFGYYLVVKYEKNNLSFTAVHVSDVMVSAYKTDDVWQVYIYDSSGFEKDFTLEIANKKIAALPYCHCVEWTRKRLPKEPMILHYSGGFFILKSNDFASAPHARSPKKPKEKRKGRRNRTKPSFEPGFILLNQSEFRHNDSLHVKAFLMDKKGRPYKKAVRVSIDLNQGRNRYHLDLPATQYSPGSFGFDWKVPDSLHLDEFYNLSLYAVHNKMIQKTINFKVTHYTFRNFTLSARLSKSYFLPGDSAFLILSAVDRNEIPIAGSKAEIRFNLESPGKLYTPYLSIPDSAFRHYLDTVVYLEPEKETWLRIPDALLASIDHGIRTRVKITMPNNDYQEFNLYCSGTNWKEDYGYTEDDKSVRLYYHINDRDTVSDSVNIHLIDRYFSENQIIATRLPYVIEDFSRYSAITVTDKNNRNIIRVTGNDFPISVSGKKTKDSLYLFVVNGEHYHLNWEIYYRGKRVQFGDSDTLAMLLKGDDPVQVLYRYLNGSAMYFFQTSILPQTQTLRIVHTLPELAYPGQKISAEVQVFDFFDKPVKHANITGTSINMQMPVIYPPNIPVFPKVHTKPISLYVISGPNESFPGHSGQANSEKAYRDYHLDRFLNYRAYYNPKGMDQEAFPSKDGQCYLQVAVQENDNTEWPQEVWVDDTLRYILVNYMQQRPVLVVRPGLHHLFIRTEKYTIDLDSVRFEGGHHNLIGINTAQMVSTSSIRYREVKAYYEEPELEKIEKYMLFLSLHDMRTPGYIQQDSNYYSIGQNGFGAYTNSIWYNYQVVGPLTEGMATFINRDTSISFYFDPNQIYHIDSGKVSQYPKTRLSLQNSANNRLGYLDSNDALGAREIYWQFHLMDSIEQANKNIKVAERPVQTSRVPGFENYYGGGGTALLNLQYDTSFPVVPNFCWMINLENPAYSFYNNRYLQNLTQLKAGWYTLITGSYEDEMLQIDSLFIDSLHRTFIRLDKLAKPLQVNNWGQLKYNYYQTLIRYGKKTVPLYDAYILEKENNSSLKKGSVNGQVQIDLNPGPYAYVVFIHQNGKTRYLSVANNQGYFDHYDMEPGSYWVQVISSTRQVFFAKEVRINPEKLLSLQIDCVTDTSFLNKVSALIDYRKWDKRQAHYLPLDKPFANLQGTITSKEHAKAVAGVRIQVLLDGIVVGGAISDNEGNYSICCLQKGIYQVEFKGLGYQISSYEKVELRNNKSLVLNAVLNNSQENSLYTYMYNFGDVQKKLYKNPVIREDDNAMMVEESISMMSGRSVNRISNMASGVFSVNVKQKSKDKGLRTIESAIHEKDRMDEMSNDPNANKIREDFRSNGFWVPNLITNKEGKTAFTFTLPDDQTKWVNYLVAINRKRQTVLNTSYTRSYKPLSVSLRVPEFVTVGDRIEVSANVRDLTGDSTSVKIQKDLGNGESSDSLTVKKYFRDQEWLQVKSGMDSLKLHYSLQYGNYIDGEMRPVPVHSNLIYDRKVQTRILDKGQITTLYFDSSARKKSLRLESGIRDLVMEEINRLNAYHYGCNEQTASKLIALVWQTKFLQLIGETPTTDKEIEKMIHRLEKAQNKDGGWGWYQGSNSQTPMTLYVAKALLLADQNGYSNKAARSAVGALINKLQQLEYSDRILTMMEAHQVKLRLDYPGFIAQMDTLNLSLEAQLNLIQLKQELALDVDVKPLLQSIKYTNKGHGYVDGNSRWGFNAATMSLTMQTYSILKKAGGYEKERKAMRLFVFDKLGYVSRNTFERAAIINALMEEVLAENGSLIAVKVNGKLIQSSGEIAIEGSEIEIENQGADISVIAIEEIESEGNTSISQGIEVWTSFSRDTNEVLEVQAGNLANLRVKVKVSEYQKYLVMNVPIPSGFQIVSKPAGYGRETGREYFADHIVIYFEALPRGSYTFDFQLLPQFDGTLTLMPAQMENMYVPEIYGREARKMVVVK